MKCISILRYLTDHLENLPLGVTTRLVVTQDLPVILANLLDMKPWIRIGNGNITRIFEGSEWTLEEEDTARVIPKIEGQVWIALYNLLSKKQCTDKYELHHYRVNVLEKLAGQINDSITRQLPILEKLKEWLLRLSIVKPQAQAAKDLVLIEAVAEIHQSLENRYAQRYDEIAEKHKDVFLNELVDSWQNDAGKLLETLDSSAARSLLDTKKKSNNNSSSTSECCGNCKVKDARQRCSKCKKVRYCNRKCQTEDWPRHRVQCTKV